MQRHKEEYFLYIAPHAAPLHSTKFKPYTCFGLRKLVNDFTLTGNDATVIVYN